MFTTISIESSREEPGGKEYLTKQVRKRIGRSFCGTNWRFCWTRIYVELILPEKHSTERIFFSSFLSSPYKCRLCYRHDPSLEPVPLSDEVKHLKCIWIPFPRNRKNISYRVSQAMTASKLLSPLLAHRALPPSWKLSVTGQSFSLFYFMQWKVLNLPPQQLTRLNHVHFKSFGRIFRIKSSFCCKSFKLTDEECSNHALPPFLMTPHKSLLLRKFIRKIVSRY